MRHDGIGVIFIRKLKPPRFDPFVPTGMDKRHIVRGRSHDEESAPKGIERSHLRGIVVIGFVITSGKLIERRQRNLNPSQTLGVRLSNPQRVFLAVSDGHRGVLDRLPFVERSHPHERGFPAPFEVD
jgi:hypothetical protein